MLNLLNRNPVHEYDLLESKRIELEESLERLFPDKDLKVVRTITRDQLFYLVDGGSGAVTTLVLDGEGSLRVRYPTGNTGDKLDGYVHDAGFTSIA